MTSSAAGRRGVLAALGAVAEFFMTVGVSGFCDTGKSSLSVFRSRELPTSVDDEIGCLSWRCRHSDKVGRHERVNSECTTRMTTVNVAYVEFP